MVINQVSHSLNILTQLFSGYICEDKDLPSWKQSILESNKTSLCYTLLVEASLLIPKKDWIIWLLFYVKGLKDEKSGVNPQLCM